MSEQQAPPAPTPPGRRRWLPKRLELKCVDKPGDNRGVVVFQGPNDTARLSMKVGNPAEYEGYYIGRTYYLTLTDEPGSERRDGNVVPAE